MDLYGQDAELDLLKDFALRIENRSAIDVGAEQGIMAAGLLEAGIEDLHVFDPHPDNANSLRTRFGQDARVVVHDYAVSDRDGSGELHVSSQPDGTPVPFGHTLLERDDTDEIEWGSKLPVTRRSLQSLLDAGEIPGRVGLLKIDTEGHDLAVVRGMGVLNAEVVMVEHWADLPRGLGVCPWSTHEMTEALRPRGFTHFAFVVHRGDFVSLKWDDGEVERGAMGNLVFLHDSALERLAPAVRDCAAALSERAVSLGRSYMQAASDRSAVISELSQALEDRSAVTDELRTVTYELRAAVDDRSLRARELEHLANERLARIHELESLAEERLGRMRELGRAAEERLALVEELKHAADARLQALESTTAQLESESAALHALRSETSGG